MRKLIKYFLVIILVSLIFTRSLNAQSQNISGKVYNLETHIPIVSATIIIDKNHTFKTDTNGFFFYPLVFGKYRVKIRAIGFRVFEKDILVSHAKNQEFNFELEPLQNQLDQIVVSASRDEKKIAREIASISVIKPYLIENASLQDLSQVLNRVPGVQVVDGQATIRSGAGYSYNTGSRVTVLLDDMPLLGADLGDVRWKFMPIEAASQIEVIKGASSVLYGSAALNGTINIRTVWPGKKPETKIQAYQSIMQNFDRAYIQWWNNSDPRINSGLMFCHRQSWGNFDLVWSGNLSTLHSHLQYADELRGRTFIKTRYRLKKYPGLSVGLDANLMLEKSGRFLLWANADSGALKQFNNDNPMDDVYRIVCIDPHIDYKTNTFSNHLRLRFYQIKRYIDQTKYPSGYDAIANLYALDEHANKKFNKNFSGIAGVYATGIWSRGNVYSGQFAGASLALYSQVEYQKNRSKFVLGLRNEWTAYDSVPYNTGLLKQLGWNYQLSSSTFLRMNFSEGYRVPTISEKYVDDHVSFLNVLPNPLLKPESGWTSEIGLQKGFAIQNFRFAIDFDCFVQRYYNMIDFKIDQWVKPSLTIDSNTGQVIVKQGIIGFKAVNIGDVLAAGFETSITGEGKIGDFMIRVLGGYTESLPVITSNDSKYQNGKLISTYVNQISEAMSTVRIDSSNALYANLATYRNRRIGKLDVEVEYWKINFGYNIQYYSVYEKVDPFVFYALKMNEFFQRSGPSDWIHSLRLYYLPNKKISIGLLINNLTNKEYATRPGKLEAARTFLVQLKFLF